MEIKVKDLALKLAERIERLEREASSLMRKASGSVDVRTRNHYRSEARYTRNKAKMLKARLEKLSKLTTDTVEELKWA